MLTERTVVITGAGASIPYGLPSTAQLREQILRAGKAGFDIRGRSFQFEREIPALANYTADSINTFINAFHRSRAESIDQFLASNGELPDIGKAYLAALLIRGHEDASARIATEGDWLQYLMGRMADDCRGVYDFKNNPISFITFNYDRLIEQYINGVMRYRFNDNSCDIDNYGSSACHSGDYPFDVFHVYGAVQPLPQEKVYRDSDTKCADYVQAITSSMQSIRVIGDERSQSDHFREQMADMLRRAKHVIVTGFGWHPDNIALLPWSAISRAARVDFGVFGVPSPVWQRAQEMLKQRGFEGNIYENGDDCFTSLPAKMFGAARFYRDDAYVLLTERLGLLR